MCAEARAFGMPIVPVLVVLAGCGTIEDAAVSPFTDPTIPKWRIGDVPEFRLGGADEREGYFFDGVVGAAFLAGHRRASPRAARVAPRVLAVADGGSREIRFYDLQGRLTARTGRVGAGPGEFRYIREIAAVDDSVLVVWDPQLSRFTFLRPDGELSGTVSPDLSGARQIRPAFVGAFSSGELVFRDNMPEQSLHGEKTGERRDSAVLLILTAAGAWRGISRRVPGTETTFVNEGDNWGGEPLIFGRSTFQAISGTGLVVASNDSLEFVRFDPAFNVERQSVLRWQPRPVSEADVEQERRHRLEEARAASAQPSVATLNGRPLSEVMLPAEERRIGMAAARSTEPAFSELLGDAEGNAWVAEFTKHSVPDRWWLILDPMFKPVGRLQLPKDLEILAVSGELLAGLRVDDLGRETAQVFRITRAP